jgi:aryl-alcohol dehydrogenase-like predicted oxidoreductase
MKRRQLGHSGIEVSEIALGTMMFGAWGNPNHAECGRMVARALEAGINFFDTADIYDRGQSEVILAAALSRVPRSSYVLATKVGNPMSDADPSMRGLSRRWITRACDDSLRRLGTDHIDLYQAHRPDPDTPLEETVAAFDGLVRAGKVRAIGTSCFSAAQLDEWHRLAAEAGLVAPATEQPPYSILARGIENEIVPAAARHGMGLVVWAPLNGGWLTGKYQTGSGEDTSRAEREPDHFDYRDTQMRGRKRELVWKLQGVATEAGLSLIQLALGFVLARPEVSAALIGPRTLIQLEDLIHAGTPVLGADILADIDAIVAPGVDVNPHDAG